MKTRHIMIGIICLLAMTSFWPAQAQMPAGLHVEANLLKNVAGDRLIISGTNVEAFRDYDQGCGWVTDGMYNVRAQMADTLKSWGVNMVRLNYSFRFLQQGNNLSKYLDFAQTLAERGIYVMPADHTYTGKELTNSGAAYPTMKAIVDGMRARGIEAYLVGPGLNEPGPDISIDAWKRAYQNLMTYLRKTALFDGVIVVDGTTWSTLLDVDAFKSLMAFDANLRGGTSNLLFSHHIYPNVTGLAARIWTASSQVPLMLGEAGIENPGASAYDPQFLRNLIADALSKGIPNGHNGIMSWQFGWCDTNKLVRDWVDPAVPYKAPFVLTEHGKIWFDNYYTKLPNTNPPPPAPTIIVGNPMATRTATQRSTALPTNTRTPTRTATPLPNVTVTATIEPSPTAICTRRYHVVGKYGGFDVDVWIDEC